MVAKSLQNNLGEWNFTKYDFGNVSLTAILKVKFNYFGNRKIKGIRESCNCLSVKIIKSAFSTTLDVTWKMSKTAKIGKKSYKYIVVFFDDNTSQQLNMSAICTSIE